MKVFPVALVAAIMAAPVTSSAPSDAKLQVQRAGTLAKRPGSAAVITGSAMTETPFEGREGVRFPGAFVSFTPKARTFWHTHPLGQSLIITAGCGLVQINGDAAVAVRPGDVVWVPSGAKHWHGASAHSPMAHYAVVEALDGRSIEVMEPVSDAEYSAASLAAGDCSKRS